MLSVQIDEEAFNEITEDEIVKLSQVSQLDDDELSSLKQKIVHLIV